jgi:hypothetical protein
MADARHPPLPSLRIVAASDASRIPTEAPPRVKGRKIPVMNYVFFGIAIVMWLGIAAALLLNPDTLREVWTSFRGVPLIVQGIGWLLLLPWMAAVWLWSVSWLAWVRLTLIVGVAWVNLMMFYPRAA